MKSLWLVSIDNDVRIASSSEDAHLYITKNYSDRYHITEKRIEYNKDGTKDKETIYLKSKNGGTVAFIRRVQFV